MVKLWRYHYGSKLKIQIRPREAAQTGWWEPTTAEDAAAKGSQARGCYFELLTSAGGIGVGVVATLCTTC